MSDDLTNAPDPKKTSEPDPKDLKNILDLFDEPQEALKAPAPPPEKPAETRTAEPPELSRSNAELKDFLGFLESAEKQVEAIQNKAIENLGQTLESQSEETQFEKTQTEEALKKREAEILSLFKQGRQLLSENKLDEGLKVFRELGALTNNADVVDDRIAKIRRSRGDIENLGAELARLKSLLETKPDLPRPVQDILDKADTDLQVKLDDVKTKIQNIQKNLQEREDRIHFLLEQAERSLSAGRIDEAIDVWREAAGLIDDPAVIESGIKKILAAREAIDSLEKEQSDLRSLLETKPAVPGSLEKTLRGLNDDLEAELSDAKNRSAKISKTLKERQNTIDELVRQANRLLVEKKLDEALKIFLELGALTGDTERVTGHVREAQSSLDRLKNAQEETAALELKTGSKPALPDKLMNAFEQSKEELDKKLRDAKASFTEAENALKNRQIVFETLRSKAQAALSDGQLDNALKTFEEMADLIDDPAPLLQEIEQIRFLQNETTRLDSQLQEIRSTLNLKPAAPQETETMLERLHQELSRTVRQAQEELLNIEQTLRKRQETVDRCLQNARNFYEKNEIPRALAEWENAAAHLDPASGFLQTISSLKKAQFELEDLRRKIASEAELLKHGLSLQPSDHGPVNTLRDEVNAETKDSRKLLRDHLNFQKKNSRPVLNVPTLVWILPLAAACAAMIFFFVNSKGQNLAANNANQMLVSYKTINDKLQSEHALSIKEMSGMKKRLSQLENEVKSGEDQNKKLSRQLKVLKEDNLRKDDEISRLSS